MLRRRDQHVETGREAVVGVLAILALDLREFHDRVLEHGALPLEDLERVIEEWIEQKV